MGRSGHNSCVVIRQPLKHIKLNKTPGGAYALSDTVFMITIR